MAKLCALLWFERSMVGRRFISMSPSRKGVRRSLADGRRSCPRVQAEGLGVLPPPAPGCLANDAAAALDDKTKNPGVGGSWLCRAGVLLSAQQAATPRAPSRRTTSASPTRTWRGLDPGRKELLLPLREDTRLREAAQHVSKFNLTQDEDDSPRQRVPCRGRGASDVRLMPLVLLRRMAKIREALGGAAVLKKGARSRATFSLGSGRRSPGRSTRCGTSSLAIALELCGR